MTRKDRLIIDLLQEVDNLDQTIKCYKDDYSLYSEKKDKVIHELKSKIEKLEHDISRFNSSVLEK